MSESEVQPVIATAPRNDAVVGTHVGWTQPAISSEPGSEAETSIVAAIRWTSEEDAVLAQHYGHLHVAEMRQRYLPQRSIAGICARADRLGVTGTPRNGWTESELRNLQEFYGRMPVAKLIREHLPLRSKAAIHTRAYALGLTSKASAPWTPSDLQLLTAHYGTMSVPELQKRHLQHRTRAAIATQARLIGRSQPAAAPWTHVEDQLLREHYPTMAIPAIRARYLAHRSCEAVRGRADVLGLRKFPRIGTWSEEQLALLRHEFPKRGGVVRLCEHFRCSGNTIRSKARALGLSGPRGKQWPESELVTLRALYPAAKESTGVIAQRTRAALLTAESEVAAECAV